MLWTATVNPPVLYGVVDLVVCDPATYDAIPSADAVAPAVGAGVEGSNCCHLYWEDIERLDELEVVWEGAMIAELDVFGNFVVKWHLMKAIQGPVVDG